MPRGGREKGELRNGNSSMWPGNVEEGWWRDWPKPLSRSPQRVASFHQRPFWLAFQRKSPWHVTTPGYLKTGTKSYTSDSTCQESPSPSCVTRALSSWAKWPFGASWDSHRTGTGPYLFVKVKKPTRDLGSEGPGDVRTWLGGIPNLL